MLSGRGVHGVFIFWADTPREIRIPNIVTEEGELAFLKMIVQAHTGDVAPGADFFVGLCEQAPEDDDTLVSITTEPTSAGGYAREALARTAGAWPSITKVGSATLAQSIAVTFTATGADFSRSFNRAFLTNVASGTSGLLLCYSGALPTPKTLLDTESISVKYELYLR